MSTTGRFWVFTEEVNVTNYLEYDWAEFEAYAALRRHAAAARLASVETTHGIIRLAVPPGNAFLFVSGIVNTVGLFDEQVTPRRYAQNMVASHNAAVALAWYLPKLAQLVV